MKRRFLILPALCMGLLFSSCDNDRRTAQGEGYEPTDQETADDIQYGIETERTSAPAGMEEEEKREFVENLSSSNIQQIEMAQLAQQNAQSQDVKDFADKIANEHRQAQESLSYLLQDENIQVREEMKDDQRDDLESLREKTGQEFDTEYLDKIIDSHENQADMLENVRDEAQDQELFNWAEERLIELRKHRDEAERIKERVSDGSGVLDL